jgi:hypothetical protein
MPQTAQHHTDHRAEAAVPDEVPAGSDRIAEALQESVDETGATATVDTVGVATGRTDEVPAGRGTPSVRGALSGDTSGPGPAPPPTIAGRGNVANF